MATPLGIIRGSSLNLKWSKCGVWWVDQWVLISWLHIEDIWCMLGFYIHSRLWHVDCVDWFILIEDSDAMISSVFHWYIRLRLWHARLLMIDLIALLSTLTLILPWLFWSLHMHTLTTVYHSTWHADPFVGILFWSSLSVLSLYHYPSDCRILVYLVCVHWWYIWDLFDCVLHDYSPLCDCVLLVHVGRTSIPLPPTLWFSVIFFISALTFASVRPCVCLFLWPSQMLGVGSSDGLYRCLGAFWMRPTYRCWLESDHWRPV